MAGVRGRVGIVADTRRRGNRRSPARQRRPGMKQKYEKRLSERRFSLHSILTSIGWKSYSTEFQ